MIDEKKLINELIIRREKLRYISIAALHNNMNYVDTVINEINSIIDIINEQPKVGEWIPCSEGLPEEPETCIVTIYSRDAHAGRGIYGTYAEGFVYFDGENWLDLDGQKLPYKVLAWQPLPEPWEGEGDV